MYSTLDRYVQVLASMLFQSEIYPVRLNKLGLIAIYRVVNTTIYNLGNKNDGGHSEQGGILVSPVKFKNFEPQIAVATEKYIHVFEAPIVNSEVELEQTR
jgi:hypothetical protein